MSIVDDAARIIDPGAFNDDIWYDTATGQPHDFGLLERTRRELHKAQAIHRAVQVLKLALTPNLKELLVEDELARWESMGIPRDILDSPEVQVTLKNKYQEVP